jgi:hypothetical protein
LERIGYLGLAAKKGEVRGVRMLRGHGVIGREIVGRKLKVTVIDGRTGRRNWTKVTERNNG